jgi:hypothetical protein
VEAAYPRARRVLGEERFRRWYVARLEKKIFREQSRARGDLVQAVPPAPPRKRVDEVIAGLVVPIGQEAATGP